MASSMSLRGRLLMLTLSLVLLPVAALALFSFLQMKNYSASSMSVAEAGLLEKAESFLALGAEAEVDRVSRLVSGAEENVRMLSTSGNMTGYLNARLGLNEQLNALAR